MRDIKQYTGRVYPQEGPQGCVMMACVSEQTRAELTAASRAFVRERDRLKAARARLHAAIIAEKREGSTVSSIEDIAPYRRGQVTRILDGAGLVEKKATGPAES